MCVIEIFAVYYTLVNLFLSSTVDLSFTTTLFTTTCRLQPLLLAFVVKTYLELVTTCQMQPTTTLLTFQMHFACYK